MLRRTLAYANWWVIMAAFFLVTWWLAGGGTPSPRLVLGVIVANTFFIAAAEQLLPRVRGVSMLHDRQTFNDVAHGVLFTFLGRPWASGVGLALVAFISTRWERTSPYWPEAWPLQLQLVLALLTWSFLNYWLHRSFHTFDALWWFHAIHHDVRGMHLFKSGRVHLIEEMLQYLLIPLPFYLMGVPAEVLIWMGLWHIFEGNLAHSNLDQRFPAVAHYVLPTVQLHYIHHAAPRHLQDSNFGGVTPLWDLLFGTYRHPERNPVPRLGIEGDPVPRSFLGQLAYPFRELWLKRPQPTAPAK